MARQRGYPSNEHESEVDLIPMMDLALNLTFFFVVLTTLAKDELARGINLPIASVAFAAEEARIPDSISVNVDTNGTVLSWGERLVLSRPEDVQRVTNLIATEAARARREPTASAGQPLPTTVIFRIDAEADSGYFQTLMNIFREHGFTQFVLRTRAER